MVRKSVISKRVQLNLQKRARQIAAGYSIILQKSAKYGYIGSGIEMPKVFGAGKTPNECEQDIRENLAEAIILLLKSGRTPPGYADRTLQINIRVTPEEKLRIESAAQQKGFRGLSDFLRAVAWLVNIVATDISGAFDKPRRILKPPEVFDPELAAVPGDQSQRLEPGQDASRSFIGRLPCGYRLYWLGPFLPLYD